MLNLDEYVCEKLFIYAIIYFIPPILQIKMIISFLKLLTE